MINDLAMSNTHGTEVQMLVLVKQRNLPLFDKRTEMTFRTLTHLIPTEKLIFSFCHLRLTDQISQRNFPRLGLFPSWLLPCHDRGNLPYSTLPCLKAQYGHIGHIWNMTWPYLYSLHWNIYKLSHYLTMRISLLWMVHHWKLRKMTLEKSLQWWIEVKPLLIIMESLFRLLYLTYKKCLFGLGSHCVVMGKLLFLL